MGSRGGAELPVGSWSMVCTLWSVCLYPRTSHCPVLGAFRASDGGSQTSSLYFSTVIFPLEIAIETKNKYKEPEQTNPSAF